MRRQQDVIQVPRLEPKDLFEKRNRRDYARLRAYNKLLEQIYHRIYASSQLSGLTSSILYTVPPFIFGLPKLDMEDCIVYLVFQLRQGGFEVQFTWPNLLRISWKHHEIDYLAKQNPIIQAMVPEIPKPRAGGAPVPQSMGAQKKKQLPPTMPSSSVSFADEIDFINSGPSPKTDSFSQFQTPPSLGQKRAADYQPPTSFIQNMERPQKESRGVKGVLEDLWRV